MIVLIPSWNLAGLFRFSAAAILCIALFFAARPVAPAYVAAQRDHIAHSAQRHGLPPDVLAAVLYNEMLGQEHRFFDALVPGDGPLAQAVRDALLGWHFLTLKQAQWNGKALLALAGSNTTVGPTGIRVSVGREIQSDVRVVGGRYRPSGMAERPSLVLDLMAMPTAIEYLAANLERGLLRAGYGAGGDWMVCARWHNTGLVADRPDVPRATWDKGTRYVARVRQFLPQMTALVNQPPAPPAWRAWVADDALGGRPRIGQIIGYTRAAIANAGARFIRVE